MTVEVGGKRLEVVLPAGLGSGTGSAAKSNGKPKRARGRSGSAAGAAASGDGLASPMQGTIVKVAVAEGDTVAEGDLVVVLEAMKMEQPLTAHKAGTISGFPPSPGTPSPPARCWPPSRTSGTFPGRTVSAVVVLSRFSAKWARELISRLSML